MTYDEQGYPLNVSEEVLTDFITRRAPAADALCICGHRYDEHEGFPTLAGGIGPRRCYHLDGAGADLEALRDRVCGCERFIAGKRVP